MGKLELRVSQNRQGHFRTEVFERYQRGEKALVGAMTEMYVQRARGFHPKLCDWVETSIEEVPHVLSLAAACLRLVRALAAEMHQNWMEATSYLTVEYLKSTRKELMRRAA